MKNTVLALFVFAASAFAQASIGGCPAFPASNVWNQPVDTLPLAGNSAAIIANIGTPSVAHVHLDDVMPINIVPGTTPKYSVPTGTPDSDPGLYAIPGNVRIEPSGDLHALIVDKDNCILYEFYQLTGSAGAWSNLNGSAAKFDLRSNALRPDGLTSADAAGLPIAPGVLRYDEVAAGSVQHALRFTAPATPYQSYLWPARHYASHNTAANLPPFGVRLRLQAGFNISAFPPRLQVILTGMKRYGLILGDNGMALGCQHDDDSRWDNNEMLLLHNVPLSAFEVVDESSLESDPNSGVGINPPPPGAYMTDLLGRPNSVPLGPGLSISAQGTLVATGGGTAGPVTIAQVQGLQAALDGKQPLLPYTPEQALTFLSPLARIGNAISCPGCTVATPTPAPPPAGGGTPPPVPAAQPPIGVLDSIGLTISGWALRPDSTKTPVTVQLWLDGPPGKGTLMGAVQTSLLRPDVTQAYAQYPLGNYGFTFPVPAQYLGSPATPWWAAGTATEFGPPKHTVYAYALDANGVPVQLWDSPKTGVL